MKAIAAERKRRRGLRSNDPRSKKEDPSLADQGLDFQGLAAAQHGHCRVSGQDSQGLGEGLAG